MNTQFLHANALTQERWSDTFFKWMLQNMQLSKFMGGEGSGMPIIVNKDLSRNVPGDLLTFRIRKPLANAGGYDDSDIEGNEEAMSFWNAQVQIHERSNGVRSNGKMTDKRTAINIMTDATAGLIDWAAEQVENDLAYALCGLGNQDTYVGEGTADVTTVNEHAPSTGRILYGGQTAAGVVTWVASDALIGDDDATDYLDYQFGSKVISIAKRKAQLASPKFKPVKIAGKGYYIMLIHPLQTKSLMAETAWPTIVQNAYGRGKENWLFGKEGSGYERMFDGLIGIWDDVLLYEYDRIPTRVYGEVFDSGDAMNSYIASGTARIARSVLLGAEAGILGWGQMWKRYTKDFDYNRKPGVATDAIYGVSKTVWRDPGVSQSVNTEQEDFAVLCVDTAVDED